MAIDVVGFGTFMLLDLRVRPKRSDAFGVGFLIKARRWPHCSFFIGLIGLL